MRSKGHQLLGKEELSWVVLKEGKRVEAEKAREINFVWCRKILYCLLETSCGKVVLS